MTPAPATPASPTRIGALLAAAALASSCTQAGGLESATHHAPPSPSATAKEPYTVAVGGDVHFEGVLRERLEKDPSTAMGPIADVLSEADLALVNLETAVTGGGTPAPGKDFRFRAPDTAFEALDAAGVDVASLANNHGMDYGRDGLADTLDAADRAGLPLVGAGRDAGAAYAPHLAEAGGDTLAFLGAADVLDEHLVESWTAGEDRPGLASAKYEAADRLVAAVESAAEQADAVIVNLHWGLEGDHCPLPHAPDLAGRLIEAGAAAVVGGHAHVLSPGGYLDGGYVHYGLGNFVFYNHAGPTGESGVLTLTLQDGEVTGDAWTPARLEGGVPIPYTGEEAEQATADWEALRDTCSTGLSATPEG
ncbi:CapA family protein [Nocardiopsis composta]|uniref:Poly-gamma-glutamate synthesis protein (Capsule biosynthesis protein) n=1 Tax=Nocardiopsis composta TaxID=157465 RepID=A0A7W8QPI1_9ACTN|nr:CapA family protein [Nocardiopsis composta]MBB5433784.1 poly-gamma-glutamate synthesis protein (capsule biosynthesis protein) [Nocardiopsis composta]